MSTIALYARILTEGRRRDVPPSGALGAPATGSEVNKQPPALVGSAAAAGS